MTIRTPDQRLRVFISSTLDELRPERAAAREAVTGLHLTPVMFELGARPHPPRELYRAYLAQSHVFIGIYWESYGWVAPEMQVSGLEDEFRSSLEMPRLLYIKEPAPARDERLAAMLASNDARGAASFKRFSDPGQLQGLIEQDLAVLLSERFEAAVPSRSPAASDTSPLPTATTLLFGREGETAEIEAAFAGDARLVTLTGAGGIGKTRLAIEVAGELGERLGLGVVFVPLATVRDPDAVLAEIAHRFGMREREGPRLFDNLQVELASKPTLLVLDNFEQVVEAAPLVSRLLMATPDLRALVTSRSLLRVRGEHEIALPPLEEASGAVDLFIDRARAVNPSFRADEETRGVIAEICRRLDGLPLAIELAAARSKILSPAALLARLGDRLGLLTSGPRDLPERQRTLRDTIGWSYDLLSDEERTLFSRLSVFVGGRTLDAIEQVCDPDGEFDVLELVASLIDKSLLRHAVGSDGEPRFTMFQTVHDYANECLLASPEAALVRERHALYYLELVERSVGELRGPDQETWLHTLDDEHHNLRAALVWADEQPDAELLLRLLYGLWGYWASRGYFGEAQHWNERGLLRDYDANPDVLARALWGAGNVFQARGDLERARDVWERALQVTRAAGDDEGIGTVLRSLGTLELIGYDFAGAWALYEESLALFRGNDDLAGIAQVTLGLGVVARFQGDFETAIGFLEEARDRARDLGDEDGAARATLNIGVAHRDRGEAELAIHPIREAIDIWRRLGSRWDLIDCMEDWGALQVLLGRHSEGALFFGIADEQRRVVGIPLWELESELLDRYVSEARTALGQAAYERIFSEGKTLSLDEGVERALAAGVLS